MASWMVHLRIADALLDKIDGLDQQAFVMGNIAPDSGVPNEDWSAFFPPKSVSHYYAMKPDGKGHRIDAEAFCRQYFTAEHIAAYDRKTYSFFLGYYIHLLTDVEWSEKIYNPSAGQYAEMRAKDKQVLVEKMKEDWYDLDFRYLHEHPDFRAFQIYEQVEGFPNVYMKEFSADAFDNRREYICGFYRGDEHGELYREYPYLNPEQAERFVQGTVWGVLNKLPVFAEL